MASELFVDNITGKTGTSGGAPITLSGDTATLGTGTTLESGADIKAAINASGDAPIYACRAWVNFNGTTGSGTGQSDMTINASGNVSSITDNGTGDYTINLTTAMPDINYSVAGTCVGSTVTAYYAHIVSSGIAVTTSTFRIRTLHNNSNLYDQNRISIAVFR